MLSKSFAKPADNTIFGRQMPASSGADSCLRLAKFGKAADTQALGFAAKVALQRGIVY